jgi:hypothetical protein
MFLSTLNNTWIESVANRILLEWPSTIQFPSTPVPKVTTDLKERRFQKVKNIQSNVNVKLNAIPLDTLHDCFEQLLEKCQ